MSVLTPARSGLARSGATRSGYPILSAVQVKTFALSGVARSGATRSNYHSGKICLAVAGVHYAFGRASSSVGVLYDSLSIQESNDEPTTAACTLRGVVPTIGQSVVMTLGSKNNLMREFAGTVLAARQFYVADNPSAPANTLYGLSLIDYTWGLTQRRVSARFTSTTVAVVAASLMATYGSGYTLTVDADIGAEVLDEITFTEQTLLEALRNLVKRVGGTVSCNYFKVVHLFFEDVVATQPTLLNRVHRSLSNLVIVRDLSQVVTRVYVQGGGSNALETIQPGQPDLPVENASWYEAPSGTVLVSGRRLTYTGVLLGGGGSLVGPGAAPSSVMVLALANGAGITDGLHEYSVTFVTASGESLPGPRTSITVGLVAAPASAPTTVAPTIGTGPDPGSHDYAVTFVTGSGETTASPLVTQATDLTPAPVAAPAGTRQVGAGVDDGTHEYAASFTTSIGETTPGPVSAPVTAAHLAPPPNPPPVGTLTAGNGPGPGTYLYAVTHLNAAGETVPGQTSSATVPAVTPPSVQMAYSGPGGSLSVDFAYTWVTANGETTPSPVKHVPGYGVGGGIGSRLAAIAVGPTGTIARNVYRTVDGGSQLKFLIQVSDNTTTDIQNPSTTDGGLGANAPTTNTAALSIVPLTIVSGPTGTATRQIYRTTAGGGTLKLLATLSDNISTTYNDIAVDAALGATAPATNTAAENQITLAGIPTGDANVTARKLYRRSGGAGLKLLTTIADNTTTTYTDTTPNASLGAAPLSTSTAYLQRIGLATIPIGGALVTSRKVYRTAAGGAQLKLAATIANNTATTFTDTVTDASLGANVPVTNTATANQVALTSIPLGAAAVTQRKVYRTAAGLSQLKLVTTIADNTTTTYTDSTADGSLGANVPTSDTSLLTQPSGNVLAGSTSLQAAGVGAFSASGGWALAGTQVLRYTGISGNSLTGIPATGVGAIQATISFNATLTAAPVLTGIPASGPGSITFAVVKGEPVDLFVQEDDVLAQAALAAQLGGGADGIHEDLITDRRLSHVEARARARARLELLGARDSQGHVGLVTITYHSRDINTHAGRVVSVNLGAPQTLSGDFLIQRVTIAGYTKGHTQPTYEVEASTVRFTFDELLRQMRTAAA